MKKNARALPKMVVISPVLVSPAAPMRRKTALKSSCAVAAVLAIPLAAVSLGIVLAGPAAAQTTLTNSSSTAILANYGTGNPFTIYSGTSISGAGDGVFGDGSQNWTVTNTGTVYGNAANGIGLGNGGTVTNNSSYYTFSTHTGTITGATDGVYIGGAPGSVQNDGTIIGTENYGVELTQGGTVREGGGATIQGGEIGIKLSSGGGYIYNNVGTIEGATGIYANGATSIVNEGYVFGTEGDGISLTGTGGASIFNSDVLSGTSGAVFNTSDGSFTNEQNVTASSSTGSGVYFAGNGYVHNNGSIQSNGYGVRVLGTAAVHNDGAIYASTLGVVAQTGSVINTGEIGAQTAVSLTAGGYVYNTDSGYIHANYDGIRITGGVGSVVNSGSMMVINLISQQGHGIYLGDGGNVTNNASASITAYGVGVDVEGGGTVQNYGAINGMGNYGNGTGTGVKLGAGGYVGNHGGTIFGSFIGVGVTGTGTVVNSGSIYAGYAGVSLGNAGFVSNSSGGFIGGTRYGVYINGINGVDDVGGTVVNEGGIGGEYGVALRNGGTVNNDGGTILGQYVGVDVAGAAGTLYNSGVIGYVRPPGGPADPISGETGVYMAAGGSVINSGYIGGSDDGVDILGGGTAFVTNASGGYIRSRYFDGVYLNGASNSLDNAGTIYGGGYGGVVLGGGGGNVNNQASAAIYSDNIGIVSSAGTDTITNAGFIGGFYAGVAVNAGTVTNLAGGYIGGGFDGVYLTDAGTIINSGLIVDTGSYSGSPNTLVRSAGIELLNGGTVINNAGGTIRADYAGTIDNSFGNIGVFASNAGASVDNSGLIEGAAGIGLLAGGTITNENGGVINGTFVGAYIGGTYATVINHQGGTIEGLEYGVALGINDELQTLSSNNTLDNAGAIYAEGFGVAMTGGTLRNEASGLISSGSIAIASYGPNTSIYNAGTVRATYGTGIEVGAGGVTNASSGVIYGYRNGITGFGSLAVANVYNSGAITGEREFGIYLTDGGNVTNAAGGTIIGYEGGINVPNTYAVSVDNAGLISSANGNGVYFENGALTNRAGGTITGDLAGVYTYGPTSINNSGVIASANPNAGTGVVLLAGGTVTNNAGGVITGDYYGINDRNNPGYVSNAGFIGGNVRDGVVLAGGGSVGNSGIIASNGNAVYVTNAAGTVNNLAGGTINAGNDGVLVGGAPGYVANAGSINGGLNGVVLRSGGSVGNTGTVGGQRDGVVIYGGTGTVTNSGLITSNQSYNFAVVVGYGGLVTNSGTIAGGGGVVIEGESVTGTLTNEAGATISGDYDGAFVDTGIGTIANAGVILAIHGYGAGIDGYQGGTITNLATGTISGGRTGVFVYAAGTLINAGQITGTSYYGVSMFSGGSVDNSGTIAGDIGVSLGYPTYGTTGTLTNSGSILGGAVGVEGYGSNFAVDNSGLIEGNTGISFAMGTATISNGGTILGLYGDAIDLPNGGSVSNSGSIIGSYSGIVAAGLADVMNSGVIQGNGANGDGVLLGAGGTVANLAGGTITGNAGGVVTPLYAAYVHNFGSIGAANGDGIDLGAGGAVNNEVSGTITANATGVNFGAGGSLGNGGLIDGGVYGVDLAGGGTASNSGTIIGGTDGVAAPVGATVLNSGSIIGTSGDGVMLLGGALDNAAGGFIQGGTDGIYAGAGANVSNAGTILDDTTAGAMLGDDVVMYNNGGGEVAGATGIAFSGTGATVVNYGTIASTNGGDAVSFDAAGTNVLTLSSGTVIKGTIDGGGSNSEVDLAGTGVINSPISNFGAGSTLNVQPGAFWTATGSWTVATVTNYGTFQAGTLNPDPPLVLQGNFVQAPSGTLQIVVTPTMSTQFIVNGTAMIAGGLKYIFTPGTYTPKTYNFLTASGGVTGNFATINYSGDVPPTIAVAHSTNSGPATYNLLLSTGTGVPGNHHSTVVTPADDAIYGAQDEAMATTAQAVNDSLLGHAGDAVTGDDAARQAACQAAERVPSGSSSTASQMAAAFASAFCGAGGWVEATGTAMEVNGDGAAPEFHADTGGFLAGIDRQVGPAGGRLGLAVGYDETWAHDDAGGKGTIGTTRVGLYGAQPVGRFVLAADIMYGHADNTTERGTGVGPASASHGSDIFAAAAQLGTGMTYGGFSLTPAAGLRFANVSGEGFSESGAGYVPLFAVRGSTPSYTSVQPYVKLGISRSYVTPSYLVITPEASIGYDYEVGDRGKGASVTAMDGTTFRTASNRLDASTANVSAGLAVSRGNLSLYARYTGYLSGNWTAQTGEAGIAVKF